MSKPKKCLLSPKVVEDQDCYNLIHQIDIEASFSYQTYTTHFSNVTESEALAVKEYFSRTVSAKIKNEEYHKIAKAVGLFAHEYTHFLDFSSTVFGLEHLRRLAEASSTERSRCNDERNFYLAKQYYDYLRTLKPSKYYTQVFRTDVPRERWGALPTVGLMFNSQGKTSTRPIVFFRFTTPDLRPIARSPISTISILEASAMAQELIASVTLAQESEDKEIKMKDITDSSLSYLYDARLTEYSVCAHLVANSINCSDILLTSNLVALLCRIVLNTPPSVFDHISNNLSKTTYFKAAGDHENNLENKKRMRAALKYRDYGALFYLLTFVMPRSAPKSGIELSLFIAQTTFNAQYPENWQETSKKYAESLAKIIESKKIDRLTCLSNAGLNNFKIIQKKSLILNSFSELCLPPCYIEQDNKKFSAFDSDWNLLASVDLEEYYSQGTETEAWVENFNSACINFS